MNLYQVSIFCLLINPWIAVGSSTDSHLEGDVSINCGSRGTSTARDGREWHGDAEQKVYSFLQIKGSSSTSSSSAVDPVPPYSTARLSRARFSYVFRVSPGQKVVRLHYKLSTYKGYKKFKDLFAVDVGPFTLLSNFSASLAARALGTDSFVKEYCIDIRESQLLNIVFSPASSQLFRTFAFINGIEIISLPASLSYFQEPQTEIPLVGKSLVYVDNRTVLEIIRRLNLKQVSVSSASDVGYVFGMWEAIPKQKQPSKVKSSTWTTLVDVGFSYLVRLYFSKMEESSGVIVKASIDEMVVDTSIRVLRGDEDSFIPMYVDYMVTMRGCREEGKRDLVIFIESNVEFINGDGPFKGFEIVKLSNLEYSLASVNPLPSAHDTLHRSLQSLHRVAAGKNVIAATAIIFLVLANIITYTMSQAWGADATVAEEKNLLSAKAIELSRQFSLAEIHSATKYFSEACVIGKGGFGKVYRGLIDEGKETVAIKRLKANSRQGAREFCTEIETLVKLKNVNLLSLIGYCNEKGEMILVYEYMAKGTLADHLYKLARKNDDSPCLNWMERLCICIGAARGLNFLHTGHLLIHRDVKASNILLDEYLLAKVSDFGLVKSLNRNKSDSHVSTKIKGTLGYLDPSYYSTGKLTRRSDIYAFGVVLFEVLCGRPAVDRLTIDDDQILTKWALENISKGRVHRIVDSNIRGEILEDSLNSFVDLAIKCLHDEPKKRPRMAQVVRQLELALKQQERAANPPLQNEIESDLYSIHDPHLKEGSLPVNDGELTAVQNHTPSLEVMNIDGVREDIDDHEIQAANEETNLSASTGNNVTTPHEGQNSNRLLNSVPPFGKKSGRKAATNKPSLFTSWDAFWNKFKPSSKAKPSSVGNQAVETEQNGDQSVNMLPTGARAIPLDEMMGITGNFSSRCVIGHGFRGTVFRAVLRSGQQAVIKTLEYIEQDQELALVMVLSSLKHENVVQLLGYCLDGREQVLLAYEFAPHGSLHDILHGEKSSEVLSWTQRVRIAIGAARGLEYIHEKAQVHRNIKSSNILVFGECDVGKITDLRQPNPAADATECLSLVAGTLGYQAPEYMLIGQLSWRSDVYNFGVVLLELLTGRQPFDRSLPRGEQNLVAWAKPKVSKEKVSKIVDARLQGKYPPKAVAKMGAIAVACLTYESESRVRMSVVVKDLHSILPR